jgi:acetoin utilization deacetylase AcuC-like enzyme
VPWLKRGVHPFFNAVNLQSFKGQSREELVALSDKADADVYFNEHSFDCARLSCAGVVTLADAIQSGNVNNGVALVRPPGHHAEYDEAM